MLVRMARARFARGRSSRATAARWAWVGCGVRRSASRTKTSRSGERRPGGIGDRGDVGQIGEAADAEAQRLASRRGRPGTARSVIAPPGPSTSNGPSMVCQVADRRVGRAFGLDEGIAEAGDQRLFGRAVGPDRQPSAGVEDDHPQVVDAVDMVGMGMGIDHRRRARPTPASSSCARMSGEVSISTRVDALAVDPLDQHRAAAAAVLRVRRVAGAPVRRPAAAPRPTSRSRGW